MVSLSARHPMIERFDFSDLRELFAKANEEKSGDQLAGIAARSEQTMGRPADIASVKT